MKGLDNVRAEFSLTALVYNLRRAINIAHRSREPGDGRPHQHPGRGRREEQYDRRAGRDQSGRGHGSSDPVRRAGPRHSRCASSLQFRQQRSVPAALLAERFDLLGKVFQALDLLKVGKVEEASSLLQAFADDKSARIKQDSKQAATAWRNLGAIAGLRDPKRARDAYARRGT